MFLATSTLGQVIVCRILGFSISFVGSPETTHDMNLQAGINGATAYAYMIDTHGFYQLNFPNISYLYDDVSSSWSEVQSYSTGGRDIGEVRAQFLSVNYVSDYVAGNWYKVDPTNFTENGAPIVREMVSRHTYQNYEQFSVPELFIDFETGVGLNALSGPNDALLFDGATQLVDVPTSGSWPTNTVTLMAWCNPTSLPAGNATVVRRDSVANVPNVDYLYGIRITNGFPVAIVRTDQGGTPGTVYTVTSPAALAINTWSNVALTVSGTTLTLLVNGVSAGTATIAGNLNPSGDLIIGAATLAFPPAGTFSGFFPGIIKDVRLYKTALNSTQVALAMSSPPLYGDPNLVSAYEFNEGTGATAIDLGGVSNGALTNYLGTTNPVYVGGLPLFNPVPGANPVVMMQWSKDGGRNFGQWITQPLGSVGTYFTRVWVRMIGRCFDLVIKTRISDPVKVVIVGGAARFA